MTKASDIIEFLKAILDEQTRQQAAIDAEIRRLEAEGYRVVGGGQTGLSGEEWKITDYRTGEVLARGDGYESYVAASQETYVHTDGIYASIQAADSERPSWMSSKLASDLQNLVWENEDEIRVLLSQAT